MEEYCAKTDVDQARITSLYHIQGQPHVIEPLKVHLRAHNNIRSSSGNSNVSFGPVILCGPPGTGKTMVARSIHAELGNLRLIETSGVGINHKLELFSILINSDENTTIFIDEAQGMDAKTQYVLLTALSERNLYVPVGISSLNSHSYTELLAPEGSTQGYQIRTSCMVSQNRIRPIS